MAGIFRAGTTHHEAAKGQTIKSAMKSELRAMIMIGDK
jgi:hypothetical protein